MKYAQNKQRGAVLLTVMIIMAVIMLMAATLIDYFLASEASEVEASLVDVRTYWAMMGHVNYMLSRVGGQGLCGITDNVADMANNNATYYCGGNTPSTDDYAANDDPNQVFPFSRGSSPTAYPAGSLQSYLDGDATLSVPRVEIQNRDYQGGTTTPSFAYPGSRRWVYPQQLNQSSDDINPYYLTIQALVRDHGVNNDLDLRIDMSIIDSGSMPSLFDLKDRSDRLTVGFCVVDSSLTNPGDSYNPTANPYISRGCNVSGGTSQEGITKIQFLMRNAPIPMTTTSN